MPGLPPAVVDPAALPRSRATAFRVMLQDPDLAFLMEAHDGLSARIVEEAGFAGIWASGLSISAALGVRDSNEASWTQILEVLEFMAEATTIPIMLDGDTGYGNFNNVRRLVRKLCQRNVAAVCIEDKLFPKTNSFIGEAQPLAEIGEFCGRIRAGKDSQTDAAFSVVARTEAFIAGWGLDEALRRARAYHEAGADAILVHSRLEVPDEILAFMREWDNLGPVIIVPTKYWRTPTDTFRGAGIAMAIWANHNLRAAITAMRRTSRRIREDAGVAGVEPEIASLADVFALAGNRELAEAEERYLASASRDIRAVILAASRGARLGELTADRPKCMIDVRGQPLLRRLVATFRDSGVRDITVVRGWRAEAIDLPSIATVDNEAWEQTGEVASLACAGDRLDGEVIVAYGDILFRHFILDELIATGPGADADILLAVDTLGRGRDWESADRLVDLVAVETPPPADWLDDLPPGPVTAIGNRLPPDSVDGEWIGLAWASAAGAARLREGIAALEADGRLEDASMLDLFDRLLAGGTKIAAVWFTGHWQDVDDAFDLARARNLT